MEASTTVASTTARHGAVVAYPRSAPPEPWQLRQASHDRGVERTGPAGWPTQGWARSTGKQSPGSFSEPVTLRQNGLQVVRTRKFKRTTDSDHVFNIAPNLSQQDFTAKMGRRHHLCLDARSMTRARKRSVGSCSRRLGLSGCHSGSFLKAGGGMGYQQSGKTGSASADAEHGNRPAQTTTRLHPSHRSRIAILRT